MVNLQGTHPLCKWIHMECADAGEDSAVGRAVPLLFILGELWNDGCIKSDILLTCIDAKVLYLSCKTIHPQNV